MRSLWRSAPVALPWMTLRLAGRYMVPMAMWFSVGQLLRYIIVQATSSVVQGGHHQIRVVIGLVLLTLLVMVSVGIPVAMLHSLRGGLATLNASGDRTSFVTAVSKAILPFVVIYFSYNFLVQDVQQIEQADLTKHIKQLYTQEHPTAGNGLLGIDTHTALAIAVGAYFVRALCEFLAKRREDVRVLPLLSAYFETVFNVFGLFSVEKVVERGYERLGLQGLLEGVGSFFHSLPGWPEATELATRVGPLAKDAVVLPLLWLTIAAVVFGRDLGEESEYVRGTKLERLYERYEKQEASNRWLLDHVASERREQFGPALGAARFAIGAGAVTFAMLCVCYVGIDAGAHIAWRGATHLIGPLPEQADWGPILVPLDFARDLVIQVLQLCLLAATFDHAVMRERGRFWRRNGQGIAETTSTDGVSERTAGQDRVFSSAAGFDPTSRYHSPEPDRR